MVEVTAEMIARGRGTDRRSATERRQAFRRVREARDKLTSSGCTIRAFEPELLRLYAERRKAALPGVAFVGLALSFVATHWVSPLLSFAWLALNGTTIFLVFALAARFLNETPPRARATSWARLFVLAETLQGVAFSLIVVAAGLHDDQATSFVLIAMLLVSAMNATVTASLQRAVYGALMPMTGATIAMLWPHGLTDKNLPLIALALGTLVYFLYLARKLHESALQTLSFQAEKDGLIAELEQSKALSDIARSRAEESNLAKSRFLATMSHELRTPLNAILGFSEIMKSELFGDHAVAVYKDYATDIHSSGEHLLMVINEILDLSRVEAGRYELREEWVDLVALIEECRHLVALRATKKDIAILQEPAAVLPRLFADTRALRQVALNLLSNAIKFTPQGGRVTIALGMSAEGAQFFSISDTGAGIPENEMGTIMSSFGRGSLAQKNAEEGTGLGLPIVKGLVDLHGGTFELTSKVRVGTRVTVTFPPARVMRMPGRIEARLEAGEPAALRTAA